MGCSGSPGSGPLTGGTDGFWFGVVSSNIVVALLVYESVLLPHCTTHLLLISERWRLAVVRWLLFTV
jgi:hypothetical protein